MTANVEFREVPKEQGEVTRGGCGDLWLDAERLTPHQLPATGQLESTGETINLAAQLFGGTYPWMPERF